MLPRSFSDTLCSMGPPPDASWSSQPTSLPAHTCRGRAVPGRAHTAGRTPASRGCVSWLYVVAPTFSGCSHLESQHCVLVTFVSSAAPFQVCCTQAVLDKHLREFNQPSCPFPLPFWGCPAGGTTGNSSVSASLSVSVLRGSKRDLAPRPLLSGGIPKAV